MTQRMLPLYEGKMGHQYDHRFASFYGTGDTDIAANDDHSRGMRVLPRNWIREEVVFDRLARREWGTDAALLGFRRVARNTDERTAIAALIPYGAASYGWILTAQAGIEALAALAATYNSYAFDYILRQFLSQPSIPQGTFAQVPAPDPTCFDDPTAWQAGISLGRWVAAHVLELTYTAHDMRPSAEDLGDTGEPFVWDPERRFHLRCELDAAFFHLYEIERDDVDYIMETFPIVKSKDLAAHGGFRTKRVILEVFDAMQRAIDTGEPYRTILDPPPGEGPRHPKESAR